MTNLTNKIISISPQKRRNNRLTIQLESGDVFGISEDVFLSTPLTVGQSLNPKEIQEILSNESVIKIKNLILNLLSYRQRSCAELMRRMKEKGYDENVISPILVEFEEKGYVNDTEFAKMFAKHCICNKQMGRKLVLNEFYHHRIPNQILKPILDKLYDENPPESLIQGITNKRLKNKDKTQNEKNKLVNQLMRKGFSWGDMESIINKIDWQNK
ncbi:MAG: hypothetical protein HOB40_03690 [Candidatus Marinimicrobia bacterium]|jgi:regulatory protein|nr:hypothetical protein [Candidatus Neomarinimicrobiota bacterium]MBT3502251.1 hypothetical protein [Candidatus Neomarinimicrobiota bacterium]MBT3840549.1 hypothetical protein [Candidatus Neomarinimicrobiota bacterium]MBT3999589.1 hypothetical protein [Candidatus Neomarinimicrobiota bacterium]MBT4282904.1 hypothetical protein [Candidatus Neomarinimicrobiota bacterium]